MTEYNGLTEHLEQLIREEARDAGADNVDSALRAADEVMVDAARNVGGKQNIDTHAPDAPGRALEAARRVLHS